MEEWTAVISRFQVYSGFLKRRETKKVKDEERDEGFHFGDSLPVPPCKG